MLFVYFRYIISSSLLGPLVLIKFVLISLRQYCLYSKVDLELSTKPKPSIIFHFRDVPGLFELRSKTSNTLLTLGDRLLRLRLRSGRPHDTTLRHWLIVREGTWVHPVILARTGWTLKNTIPLSRRAYSCPSLHPFTTPVIPPSSHRSHRQLVQHFPPLVPLWSF